MMAQNTLKAFAYMLGLGYALMASAQINRHTQLSEQML